MPKFKAGEIVLVKQDSFSPKENFKAILAYEDPEEQIPCPLCDNPECVEWANVRAVDGGWHYHISECQMEKIE